MFFWRKKNDEFEWQKYVRTTVLVRRKERRQRLEDAGSAAVFGVRQASWLSFTKTKAGLAAIGRATRTTCLFLAEAGKYIAVATWQLLTRILSIVTAASRSASASIWRTIKVGAVRSGDTFQDHIVPFARQTGHTLRTITKPFFDRVASPELSTPIALIGVIAGVAGGLQFYLKGITTEALFPSAIALFSAIILILARPDSIARPVRKGRSGKALAQNLWSSLTQNSVLRPTGWALGAVVVAGVIASSFWVLDPRMPEWANLSAIKVPEITLPNIGKSETETLSGRARAVSGDHIRIGRETVKLDGIEAPLPAQTCKDKRSRRWRCGRRSKVVLARIIRRHRVACTVVGQTAGGIKSVRCRIGKTDVASELVKQGYAFSQTGWLESYNREEATARDAKRGIWQGESQRPSDYRNGRWKEAAKKAPGGCPIKGRVRRRQRLYTLPWDGRYARIRVQESRGGQWFCSEQDAREAGFKPANSS